MRKTYDYSDDLDDLPVGNVRSHFLDSGSFTFWTKAREWADPLTNGETALRPGERLVLVKPKIYGVKGRRFEDFYRTMDFRSSVMEYMDEYAAFVKKYKHGIDLYANVDVIPNAELTWKNQQYLEKEHGLRPVPVVHYRTDLKWLKHYMELGYPIIGIGGLVGSSATEGCRKWLDRVFNYVCQGGTPLVKLHGFGVTVFDLLIRYPWYSVDSTTWTKIAAYGGVIVPHKRNGKFVFDERPYIMKFSMESPTRENKLQHYLTSRPAEQKIIREWFDKIGIALGEMDKYGDAIKWGVITRHTERRVANLIFFESMLKGFRAYPWRFDSGTGRGFGLYDELEPPEVERRKIKPRPSIIYYSGEGSKANPEITLQDDATIMLTYVDFRVRGKPTKRFKRILKVRKKGIKK